MFIVLLTNTSRRLNGVGSGADIDVYRFLLTDDGVIDTCTHSRLPQH